ncbi:MAG: NAD(P)-dependent oxidoreductase [Granulosicoccus sp.]|nr:NAD(P)-dependent oxidoreductase [Granulosicoccus sp.]
MDTAGFIGLGMMGLGMSRNLLAKNGSLTVFDLNPTAIHTLVSAGSIAVTTPREIGEKCATVFLCLPTATEVRAVLFGDNGLLTGDGTVTQTIIDTTTLDRLDALAIGAELDDAGVDYADCPVSGLPARAENGTLTMMFGGRAATFERVKPLLATMGEDIRYCGDLGCGQAMKAINNIIYNINIAALCEVLPLATAVGLDPEEVGQVVRSASSRSFASDYFVPRMLDRQFHSDFSLQGAYKDIVNVQRMAVETRAMTPLVNAMTTTYQSAIAAGFGDEPKSAMLKVYEHALGVEFRHTSDVEKD